MNKIRMHNLKDDNQNLDKWINTNQKQKKIFTQEKDKKLTVRLTSEMHLDLKKYCIENNYNIQSFIIDLISDKVYEQNTETTKSK